jgi:iron complex outermembrane receptor protein
MGSFSFNNKYEKYDGSLRFFYNFGEHNISDGFHSLDKNYGITFNEAFRLFKGNIITVGVDYKNYGGIAENIKAMNGAGMVFVDTTNYETGAYLLIQQNIYKKLTLNAGFRCEFSDVYGKEPIPTAGLAYRLTPKTVIKASVSKGFRSPTLRELYMWAPANADLKPERMINYELGILKTLFSEKITIDASIYKSEGSNMIQTIIINSVPKYMNTGEFANIGVDFGTRYKFNNSLNFFINYSYINMDNLILAIPEQQISMGATWKYKKLTLGLNGQYIANLILVTKPEVKKEDYIVVNAKVNYDYNKHVCLFVKGENLLNQEYQINYNYPMPGICLFVGLNIHF